MRKIGFDGGHTVYELGPVSDVVLFFECLSSFVVSQYPDQDWSLLTDRLYRRYLRREELERSFALMERARSIFSTLPSASVEWDEGLQTDRDKTWLDSRQDTLGAIFFRYFDLFSKAKDSAISFLDEFGIYQPVRVLVSDMPALIVEKRRPLNEYDALGLSDLPFWLR
ncbi:hypothetical protein ACOTEK_16695 [Achromobacter xylosoxidans]|jgi:hypothetical protein|uniref:hypothetical protein n=1 Tax=Alcaligenes xylosoxydans xylosoxydans TaxID=85698 RepID=UPI0009BDA6EE|nr:hypothetical protein [Achromobacter xylosoxidans]QQE55216.1 hypothetical protein I6H41_20020 [Achromobacter xylosoxidans]QQV14860.1 hypothetical protein I6I48_02960 [Achromobacter xylosoxidans]UXL04920.1 hypothetical protein N4T34_29490 [Achromobacter xylosoxidans]